MSSTTASTSPGDRSAAEIEREVEATRARLTGTVEELKERVSPGQITDQAMDWLRGSGGREFVSNLGSSVRDNPIPVVLIAAGIGWLAFGGRSSRAGSRDYSRDDTRVSSYPAYDGEDYPGGSYSGAAYGGSSYADADEGSSLGSRAGQVASDLRGKAGDLRDRAGETASGLRDQASGIAGRVGEAASGAWNSATGTAQSLADSAASAGRRIADRASEAWDSATGAASGIGQRAGDYQYEARGRASDLFEAQPLLIGAAGLAIGAALGAIFPASDAENRLMGETRDDLVDRAQALAGEAYDKARDLASESAEHVKGELAGTYDRAKERLNESGLNPSAGASVLGEVARDLREAVERTASEVAGNVREATDRPSGDQPGGSNTPRPTDRGPL